MSFLINKNTSFILLIIYSIIFLHTIDTYFILKQRVCFNNPKSFKFNFFKKYVILLKSKKTILKLFVKMLYLSRIYFIFFFEQKFKRKEKITVQNPI